MNKQKNMFEIEAFKFRYMGKYWLELDLIQKNGKHTSLYSGRMDNAADIVVLIEIALKMKSIDMGIEAIVKNAKTDEVYYKVYESHEMPFSKPIKELTEAEID